jgi:hypothetical protein
LHIRQAIVHFRADRIEEATSAMQRAIHEIHALCEAVPWNTDYWNSAQWFHQIAIRELSDAKRNKELDTYASQIANWLKKQSGRLSDDALAKQKLQQATVSFVKVLRSNGLNQQADELLSITRQP